MAVINDPDLREIARQIVSDPGFSRTSNESLHRALGRFTERTTPYQRRRVAETMIVQWLLNEHAEYMRERVADSGAVVPAVRTDEMPWVITGQMVEGDASPERGRETVAPVSALRFRSESPGTRHPVPELPAVPQTSRSHTASDTQAARTAADNLPADQAQDDTQNRLVGGDQFSPEPPSLLPVTPPAPVPVQQPSRKIAAYQQMFPELGFRVQTASGAKPLAEFTREDIEFRCGELRGQRQAWHSANVGDEARVKDRDRLNARDRVRIAERTQNIRDTEAEEKRLALAERELDGYGYATIGELPAEALTACGFKRRAA